MGDYTPGRWTVSPEFPLCVWESDGRKVDPIAYAVPYRPADFKLAEVEANARLIAAAPDLLVAFKYLCSEIHNRCSREELEEVVALVEPVIEKAEGLA